MKDKPTMIFPMGMDAFLVVAIKIQSKRPINFCLMKDSSKTVFFKEEEL